MKETKNEGENVISAASVNECFEAMKGKLPAEQVSAMGVTDDYTKATLFIETLLDTVKRYFKEYAQVPEKDVVMEAARMLIDTMLVSVALPRMVEKYFMIFGLNAVSAAYDYFFVNEDPSIAVANPTDEGDH